MLGFIEIRGHAQANGGVVPHFWDPVLVKTDPRGTVHCAMAIAAPSGTEVDPVDVGNGVRFRNGKAPASATRRKGDKAVLTTKKFDVTMLLPAYGSLVNGLVPGTPDPIEDGNDAGSEMVILWCRRR